MKVNEYVVPTNLLKDYVNSEGNAAQNKMEQAKRTEIISAVFKNAGIDVEIDDIKCGPTFSVFELSITKPVQVKKIHSCCEDLNLWLNARERIRILAPIPGTVKIGIEVPNSTFEIVGLKGLIESDEFKNAKQTSLSFCAGVDVYGKPVVLDIDRMPHLLAAGATGTGKSIFINSMLISLMFKYSPEELRFILVDPKIVEFCVYKGMPHLLFDEILTEYPRICSMFDWLIQEMNERYKTIAASGNVNISQYNAYAEENNLKKLPKLLLVIDEFADLVHSSKSRREIEEKIHLLTAKSRAAGIHIIITTQRPGFNTWSPAIATNFPTRVAFKLSSLADSMAVIGESGAEALIGHGDLLYRTMSMINTARAQGCFVDTCEINSVCNYLKANFPCDYNEKALEAINARMADDKAKEELFAGIDKELIKKAMRYAIPSNTISISMLQRKLEIGFPKAGKLLDLLIEKGYVSEIVNGTSREILMTKEEFEKTFGEPL